MVEKLAIHQPNFAPWLGYFHKISLVDTFMFFDHVQAPQGKSWVNRTRVQRAGNPLWLTVPRGRRIHRPELISDLVVAGITTLQRDLMNKIESYYQKAPYYLDVKNLFYSITFNTNSLQSINEQLIRAVTSEIGLDVNFMRSSDLLTQHPELREYSGNKLILELCLRTKAQTYVSGTGCVEFIRPKAFQDQGVEV
jgi:hypothetical protein